MIKLLKNKEILVYGSINILALLLSLPQYSFLFNCIINAKNKNFNKSKILIFSTFVLLLSTIFFNYIEMKYYFIGIILYFLILHIDTRNSIGYELIYKYSNIAVLIGSVAFTFSFYVSNYIGYKEYFSSINLYKDNSEFISYIHDKHYFLFFYLMTFLTFFWFLFIQEIYKKHKNKKVYKYVDVKEKNSLPIESTIINFIFFSLACFYIYFFITSGNNSFFTLSKNIESIVQSIYHTSFLLFFYIAYKKKYNINTLIITVMFGVVLFHYEIVDVILFEALYNIGAFPATNPLSLKLFLQFLSVSFLVYVLIHKKRNFTVIFGTVSGLGILFTMLLYHTLFIQYLIKPTQEYNLNYIYEQLHEKNIDHKLFCEKMEYICYTEENELLLVLDNYIENDEYIAGYDPLIINSFRHGSIETPPNKISSSGEFSQIYYFFENIIVEWDAAFLYYKASENKKILIIDIYNYIKFFRSSLFSFYTISLFMLYFWFFGFLQINTIHQKKMERKNAK